MTLKKKILIGLGAVVLVFAGMTAWMLVPALLPAKNLNVGVAVGGKVPMDMALRDSAGQPTTLAQQMGPKGAVLFFVRSADWCAFCKAQLKRTQDIKAPLDGQGMALISLSYDKPELLARFAAEKAVTFTLLADEGSKMIDALGLRDPKYEAGYFAYGVPRPTTLVVAPDGTVKAKFVAEDYRSRISNDGVLALVRGAGL